MTDIRTVCVFAGSASGTSASHRAAAAQVGHLLADRGIRMVYGGGADGLMGIAARSASDAGGSVLGVLPSDLFGREVTDNSVGELVHVGSMHERKQRMSDEADAFLALPGGLGTLEELAEQLTWAQLGLHGKPIGVLDVDGHWSLVVAWLDRAVETGYLRADIRALLHVDRDAIRLLDTLHAHAHLDALPPPWARKPTP